MKIRCATDQTAELRDLWAHALKDVRAKRGGVSLLVDIAHGDDIDSLLGRLVHTGALWTVSDGDHLVAFGFYRDGVIEGIYVVHGSRRQKIATKLVQEWLQSATPPRDGYALPGDRAMKSLYESLGWKARLLTMRGE